MIFSLMISFVSFGEYGRKLSGLLNGQICLSELFVGSVVEWLRRVLMTNIVSVRNPLEPFCCVLGKDTLWHILLRGGPD